MINVEIFFSECSTGDVVLGRNLNINNDDKGGDEAPGSQGDGLGLMAGKCQKSKQFLSKGR